jgi:hypothetical protein
MKRLLPSVVLLLLLAVQACNDNNKNSSTLRLTISPKWGNDDLRLQTVYPVNGGYMKIENMGFYLSHIKLVRTDNTEVEVDSAALFLFNNNKLTLNLNAPVGGYKGIKFGVGLDSAQNKISPSSRPSTDPVFYDNTLYWDGNREHLFVQLEGRYGTSSSSVTSLCFYHIGFDSMYRAASVTRAFTVAEGQTLELNMLADVSTVFNGTNAVNIATDPATHTNDYPAVAHQFADRFTQIFSIP